MAGLTPARLPSSRAPDERTISHWLRVSFWVVGFGLGILETIASRFSVNVDGISYLDLGHAVWTGDWKTAVNGYWSPLYAWLLGAVLHFGRVPGYWESTVIHVVNFIIFLGSMAAFELFLNELCRLKSGEPDRSESVRNLPIWVMQGIGYSICLYAGLVWISIWNVTPDQIVAVEMYLVAALLLRMRRELAGWGMYAGLGALLGIGYLTKAALLPLGMVFLVASLFLATHEKFGTRFFRMMVSALVFAVVAAPLVIALSRSMGRLTSGETGKIAYAEMVDGMSRDALWTGEGNPGTPKHPVRKPLNNPEVFEFATPVGGTYPPWYDASYWFDGMKSHVDVSGQIRVLGDSARAYGAIAARQLPLITALLVLCALGWKSYSYWREMWAIWPVWITPLAGLAMFSLVLVETRYVASFLVIIAMCCLAGMRWVPSRNSMCVLVAITIAVGTFNLIGVARFAPRNAYSALFRPRNVQWEVAEALAGQGVQPGDHVATIIDHRLGDYWAHLDGLKIVDEIPYRDMSQVAKLDESARERLFDVLRAPGAKVIVTTPVPPAGTGFHWRRLGNTEYFDAALKDDNLASSK